MTIHDDIRFNTTLVQLKDDLARLATSTDP